MNLSRFTMAWLAALGLLGAPTAQASRWSPVAQADAGFYYIDAASIEGSAERRQAWTVLDHRQAQRLQGGQLYRSTQAQVQVNCKARLARLVHLTYFSGPMLTGSEVLKQGMLQDWLEIDAGSPMQRIAYRLC